MLQIKVVCEIRQGGFQKMSTNLLDLNLNIWLLEVFVFYLFVIDF